MAEHKNVKTTTKMKKKWKNDHEKWLWKTTMKPKTPIKSWYKKPQKKTRYPQTYQKSVLSTTRKATPQNRKFVKISNKKTKFLKCNMKKTHSQIIDSNNCTNVETHESKN